MNRYQKYCKPQLAEALHTLGLDKVFHRAQGANLYYRNEQDQEQEVLDLLGGYGATLLGHNHPDLIEVAKHSYDQLLPFNNQFSLRQGAALLAEKLNRLLKEETGWSEDFRFSFTSTGAESVEIALTHAERKRSEQVDLLAEEAEFSLSSLAEDDELTFQLTDEQCQLLGVECHEHPEKLMTLIRHFNAEQVARQPHFVALKNAFHGKLASSIQLTHGSMYREHYHHLGLKVHFIPVAEIEQRMEPLQRETTAFVFSVKKRGKTVSLIQKDIPMICAILAEPVQGEGGIHCLTEDDAQRLHQARAFWQCPLIADEVQSGSGRCGSLLAGRDIGLRPDYVVLSKALGGGIAKIGFVAIRASMYCHKFDLVQSSTFGEDEHSAAIASAYLDLLYADNKQRLQQVHELGETIQSRLTRLKEAYPDVIADVRGRGLLIGIEFNSQADAPSIMFRGMDYQESLGYVVTGFLLNQHHIRVAPSSSAPNVVRLEPNLCLTHHDIERLMTAFEDVCRIIQYQDAYYFLKHLSQPVATRNVRQSLKDFRPYFPELPARPETEADVKVAFVNHLISSDWMWQVDPSMEGVPIEESDYLLKRLGFDWRAAPFPPMRVTSATGVTGDFILYPLAVTSAEIEQMMKNNDLEKIREAIRERVEAARDDGCKVAGLGMFTSVATNNCKSVKVPGIGLTTGNSLTVGMAIEMVLQTVEEKQLEIHKTAVIGAAGNIGAVYAAIAADFSEQLILIGSGRHGSQKRLLKAVYGIYETIWSEILAGKKDSRLGTIIGEHPQLQEWLNHPERAPEQSIGQLIYELMQDQSIQAPIVLSDDIELIHQCDLVVCATNASSSFLDVGLIRPNAIVCDVSVPHNISQEALETRPDIVCIRGGVVSTPNGASLDARARAYLNAGEVYACMAESLTLGLEGEYGHYSYGDLSKSQVTRILDMAKKHGFGLAGIKSLESM
ncbi:aminotransferase class III-fold pyridoxal phosphate-dependent enzyme [Vibrio spartinae]|uniref:Putrescine aminotransferase n=1 Tax=Vibrio spartinae TaxID=1918945 RepID=A0ABX6QVT5_9VIBR|nr:aminotransferase class III-fold pyridoxal phosphate-dependent enzyme [Vibrio spartinae]QMV13115.1 Putrescine aminotransferase [Vibrio spartinae]